MRVLSDQCNAALRMVSTVGVVVRIGVHVGVGNSLPINNMPMGKEHRICVVAHKERYEKKRYYFLCFTHIER